MKDKQNNFSYGECSPLPDFSYESIDDAELQLQKLSTLLKDFDVDNDLSIIENFSSKRNLFLL
jgi:O-succinylbenzoate synthase